MIIPFSSFYTSNLPSLASSNVYYKSESAIKVFILRFGNKPFGPKNRAYGFNYFTPSAVANKVSNSIYYLSHFLNTFSSTIISTPFYFAISFYSSVPINAIIFYLPRGIVNDPLTF